MSKPVAALYVAALLVLAYFTYYLAVDFPTFAGRNQMPFPVWVINTIDLFIHEAGHFFFGIFGRYMHFLGGSLFQILLPIVTVVVFYRTSGLKTMPFTLYWVGQNMADVSVYMADAPYQRLQLISKHAIHDWRWLMGYMGIMDWAEDLAGLLLYLGIAVCVTGLGIGGFVVYRGLVGDDAPPVSVSKLPRKGRTPAVPGPTVIKSNEPDAPSRDQFFG